MPPTWLTVLAWCALSVAFASTVVILLDIYARKGAARRVPHPSDGRRLLVEINPDHIKETLALFDDLAASMADLCSGYTDEPLETVIAFVTEASVRQRQATAALTEGTRIPQH